jgi:AcrR family transcriptional regulator
VEQAVNEAPARAPLTRERIIEVALRLSDAEGLEAVTMRRLGRELGVEAMSLYNHVEGKEAILTGVLERVLAEFELPEGPPGDWIERSRELARRFRDLLLRHPGSIPLFSEKAGPITDLRALRPIEVALETLRRGGLSQEDTIHGYHALVGFVVGNVMLEVAGFLSREAEDPDHMEQMLRAIPAQEMERFANLIEMLPALHECDSAAEFEHGLDLLLAGLRSAAGGPEGPPA